MAALRGELHNSIDPVDENLWTNLVGQSNLGSFYHRYAWLRAIERTTENDPRHVVVYKDDNIVGGLPGFLVPIEGTPLKRLVSGIPGFGGPVLSGDEGAVFDAIASTTRNLNSPEVVGHDINLQLPAYTTYNADFIDYGYRATLKYCRFVLDLNHSWVRIEDGMDKDRRYNLRKAREQTYEVSKCSLDSASLRAFYDQYERTIARVNGVQYPLSFFQTLGTEMTDEIELYRADVDGTTVGYHLYLFDDLQSTIVHTFSGVAREHFEYYPSELIHEHVIREGIDAEYDTYDFGRTIADRENGLFRYKREYGGDVLATPVWRRPFGIGGRALYKARRSMERSGRLMPLVEFGRSLVDR